MGLIWLCIRTALRPSLLRCSMCAVDERVVSPRCVDILLALLLSVYFFLCTHNSPPVCHLRVARRCPHTKQRCTLYPRAGRQENRVIAVRPARARPPPAQQRLSRGHWPIVSPSQPVKCTLDACPPLHLLQRLVLGTTAAKKCLVTAATEKCSVKSPPAGACILAKKAPM